MLPTDGHSPDLYGDNRLPCTPVVNARQPGIAPVGAAIIIAHSGVDSSAVAV